MKNLITRYPYVTIFILWISVLVANLGTLVPNIMEARNFITAREMVVQGNWILTTMDGLPRYEKPPLPTWFSAIIGKFFGFDNLALLRLPAAMVTLLLLIMVYKLTLKLILVDDRSSQSPKNATQLERYIALIASLITGTSFYVVYSGREGTWDIFALSFMVTGVYFLYLFLTYQNKLYRNALLAGIFIGLSFMSKGPIAFYVPFLPFLLSYGMTYKFKTLKGKFIPLLLIIAIVIILSSWWALYIYLYDTTAASEIAKEQSSRWLYYELKPFYYYWSFFVQSGIWTIIALCSLIYPYVKRKVTNKKLYKFLFYWTIFAVLLLSLIPTKKSRYLLPVLVPLAMTMACYLEYVISNFSSLKNNWEKGLLYFYTVLIAIIGIGFSVAAFIYFGDTILEYLPSYIITSVLLLVIGIYLLYSLKKKDFNGIMYGSFAFIMTVTSFGFPFADAFFQNKNYNSIAELNKTNFPVYVLESMAPEMVWEYGKPSEFKTMNELLNIKNNTTSNSEKAISYGVLTSYSEEKTRLDSLKNSHIVKWETTYDINTADSTKRSYKDRLKVDFYKVYKKR